MNRVGLAQEKLVGVILTNELTFSQNLGLIIKRVKLKHNNVLLNLRLD